MLLTSSRAAESPEFLTECEQVALLCNTVAMQELRSGRPEEAERFLKKAEAFTEPNGVLRGSGNRRAVRAVTFNNLGCLYKEYG